LKSDKTLKKWYNKINRKFFLNALPSNVCVRYATEEDDDEEERCEERYCGWADTGDGYHKYVIVISKIHNLGWMSKLATLTHEMIHISTDLRDDHSTAFEQKRQMLGDRGIFKKNAIYKGYTLF
jgi:hypothetical protein